MTFHFPSAHIDPDARVIFVITMQKKKCVFENSGILRKEIPTCKKTIFLFTIPRQSLYRDKDY